MKNSKYNKIYETKKKQTDKYFNSAQEYESLKTEKEMIRNTSFIPICVNIYLVVLLLR